MSLFGSLFTGVSSLVAQSQSMSMISNNIANVNTTAYKRNVSDFSTLVTATGQNAQFSPGGVRACAKATIDQQGLLQQTTSTTDISISGDGFFAVQHEVDGIQETLYTRAGAFSEDSRGFLRNSAGFYLMGWPLDSNNGLPASSGDLESLTAVNVAFMGGMTRPTTDADITLNMDARQDPAAPGPHFSHTIRVFDTIGAAHDMSLKFTRTAAAPAMDWDLEIFDPEGNSLGVTSLEFDGDGALITPAAGTDGRIKISIAAIDWGNGSNAQDIDLDITDCTQFSGDYNVVFSDQNGADLGLRTGVAVDVDGYVNASFSNGQTAKLYKLPISTFTNPNGLEQRSGNVFSQTLDSGDYNLREANQGGAGQISSSSLEASNVDLAEEFSNMIITQRAYSAGTKVISTADQMLQELLSIR
ncbi:MAG: flagellar hook protein FlgE [Pseudomonadota bacterium]|nr:flagellar hook protein FlgE [Pseudomonadota bacterium]